MPKDGASKKGKIGNRRTLGQLPKGTTTISYRKLQRPACFVAILAGSHPKNSGGATEFDHGTLSWPVQHSARSIRKSQQEAFGEPAESEKIITEVNGPKAFLMNCLWCMATLGQWVKSLLWFAPEWPGRCCQTLPKASTGAVRRCAMCPPIPLAPAVVQQIQSGTFSSFSQIINSHLWVRLVSPS